MRYFFSMFTTLEAYLVSDGSTDEEATTPPLSAWAFSSCITLSPDDESLRILRKSYAKGEITEDQFDQMTRDLQSHDQR